MNMRRAAELAPSKFGTEYAELLSALNSASASNKQEDEAEDEERTGSNGRHNRRRNKDGIVDL